MRVTGQRWEFQIGNTIVIVENAWSWVGYSQERVRVNDEVFLDRQGWFWLLINKSQIAEFQILDEDYGVIVGVEYLDHEPGYNIYCRIITDTEIFEPTSFTKAKWDTKTYL